MAVNRLDQYESVRYESYDDDRWSRTFSMPSPTSEDAPNFAHSQPVEVRRFVRLMESLMERAGIVDDAERKEKIVEYVDVQTEDEWRAFDTFDDGSWCDFRSEIFASYPEAYDDGSIAALDRICQEYAGIRRCDEVKGHTLIRRFRAEAKKLSEVLMNADFVDKFMKCLAPSFASSVMNMLDVTYGHYKDRGRHKNNKYDLSEVFAVVRRLLDETAVGFDKFEINGAQQNVRAVDNSIDERTTMEIKELAPFPSRLSQANGNVLTSLYHSDFGSSLAPQLKYGDRNGSVNPRGSTRSTGKLRSRKPSSQHACQRKAYLEAFHVNLKPRNLGHDESGTYNKVDGISPRCSAYFTSFSNEEAEAAILYGWAPSPVAEPIEKMPRNYSELEDSRLSVTLEKRVDWMSNQSDVSVPSAYDEQNPKTYSNNQIRRLPPSGKVESEVFVEDIGSKTSCNDLSGIYDELIELSPRDGANAGVFFDEEREAAAVYGWARLPVNESIEPMLANISDLHEHTLNETHWGSFDCVYDNYDNVRDATCDAESKSYLGTAAKCHEPRRMRNMALEALHSSDFESPSGFLRLPNEYEQSALFNECNVTSPSNNVNSPSLTMNEDEAAAYYGWGPSTVEESDEIMSEGYSESQDSPMTIPQDIEVDWVSNASDSVQTILCEPESSPYLDLSSETQPNSKQSAVSCQSKVNGSGLHSGIALVPSEYAPVRRKGKPPWRRSARFSASH